MRVLFYAFLVAVSAATASPGSIRAAAPPLEEVAMRDVKRILRVCMYDMERFRQTVAEPIPGRVLNVRTKAARANESTLMEKIRDICASRSYWEERLIESTQGMEPEKDDLKLAEQIVYTLGLQMRYLKDAHKTYLRVIREEEDRIERVAQLEEIFRIRTQLERAKKNQERGGAVADAREAVSDALPPVSR
jgi:hypothetical protein